MPSRPIDARIAAVLACGLSLAVAGCARKSVRAGAAPTAPATAEAERPMSIAPDTDAAPPIEAVAPPAVPASPAAPPPIAIPSAKPSAPHKPVEEPAAADADSEPSAHPAAPQISPQLSPGDQASYARKTGDDHRRRRKEPGAGERQTIERRATGPRRKDSQFRLAVARCQQGRRLGPGTEPRSKGPAAFGRAAEFTVAPDTRSDGLLPRV